MQIIEYNGSVHLGKKLYYGNQELIEIKIADGIKRIGESCFENCKNLRSVIIPDSVIGIHKNAFAYCENLESVQLPAGLQNITEKVFYGCAKLKQIVLPAATRYVSNRAFDGCSALREVFLENDEIRISRSAFDGCTGLLFEQALNLAEHFVKPLEVLIQNGANGLEGRLRTFADRNFLFDDVECNSIESVLEAFKFMNPATQEYVCALSARDAYYEGQREEASRWKETGILYWNGISYDRGGEEYQNLLNRLFQAIFEQDAQFRLDVAFLKNANIRSKVGGSNPNNTVLTKTEYLSRLLHFSGGEYHWLGQKEDRQQNKSPVQQIDPERVLISAEKKKNKQQRIVVMGGSFNPPTIAHQKILLSAVNALRADYGIFVPSSDAYVRRKMRRQTGEKLILSEQTRLEMLKKMCEDDERFRISTCEYQDDGKGHTFDTLSKIQEHYPDALLYFLIGGDKLSILTRWHRKGEFFDQFEFAVVKRHGDNPEQQIEENRMLAGYRGIFHIIPELEGISEISSTVVRRMLKEKNPEVRHLLHAGVYELLKKEEGRNMGISLFRGKYDFLSNFYEAEIEYQGIYYLNSEAAFQAQKCMTEEEKRKFSYLSAAKAKRMGRQVSLRSDWEQVKVSIMEEIVRAKFTQNQYLAQKLLETGDSKLEEGNTWHDIFWGVDAATGEGENHLGKILMKVRGELKDISQMSPGKEVK